MLYCKAFLIIAFILTSVKSILIENAFTSTESINYLYQTPVTNLHILNDQVLIAKNKVNQTIGIDILNYYTIKWNIGDILNDYQLIFNNDNIFGWKYAEKEIIKIDSNGQFEFIPIEFEIGHLYDIKYGGLIILGTNGELSYLDQQDKSHIIKAEKVSTVLVDSSQGNIFLVLNGQEILKLSLTGSIISRKSISVESIRELKSGIALTHNDQIFKIDSQLNFKGIENYKFNNLAVINSNFLYSRFSNEVKLIAIDKKVAKEVHSFKTTSNVQWYSNPFNEILIVNDGLTRVFYDLTDFLQTKNANSIKKIQFKLEGNYPYDFVINTSNNELAYLAIDEELNGELFSLFNGQKLKTVSTKNNQFSSSKDLYIIIDAPENEKSKIENEQLSKEFNEGLIFTNWFNRVLTHATDLFKFILNLPGLLTEKETASSIFNKLIVFYDDRAGKLVAVNSHDEGVAWTTDIENDEIFSLIQLNEDANGVILALFKNNIYIIDPNEGKLIDSFPNENNIDVKAINDHYVLENDSGFTIPQSSKEDIFLIKQSDNEITGNVIFNGSKESVKTWSINFDNPIIQVQTIPRSSKISSVGIPLVDKSILYKYLNENIFAVLTMEEKLKLYLIDGISGELLYTYSHDFKNEIIDPNSISLVIDNNWIIYSYFTISPRLEQRINVIDLFSNKQNQKITKITAQSFIFPERILKLSSTQSKYGITTKSIIALTESGSLVEIPKYILNSRRPINEMKPTEAGNDFRLTPYDPIIYKSHNHVLNHKYQISPIGGEILIKPTQYESSSVVCYFNDQNQFCSVIKPSSSFDLLNKKFEKLKLILTLIILIGGYLISKPYVDRKKLKAYWLDYK
ncbi:uncharacterized protein KGF55_002057 [Candida pseudojiufengensis]|uniref:uncharacterized protein n=1 Tax=Candida pseudojiufengensis TaxID=497109 RepID=UPI0022247561|nr:uncharacterized protein KGF55_002057 [Candida pseudojiufengensis]KAI5964115.1 hypothetical protein KGF55_002057 [Candida pseudojiufengensis]